MRRATLMLLALPVLACRDYEEPYYPDTDADEDADTDTDSDTDTDTDTDSDTDTDTDTDTELPDGVDPLDDATALLAGWPDADLSDPAAFELWATASTPSLLLLTILPTATALDPLCPVVTEVGDDTIYSGGCVDDSGVEWFGTAVASDTTISWNQFGNVADAPDCPGLVELTHVHGSMQIDALATWPGFGEIPGDWSVSASFHVAGPIDEPGIPACTPLDVTMALTYEASTTTVGSGLAYSGEGRVGFLGLGAADMSTVDELIDEEICESEPVSGVTSATAGGQTLAFHYDGDTDCSVDSPGEVPVTLNGDPVGTVSTLCATGGRAVGWLTLLAPVLLLRRRR